QAKVILGLPGPSEQSLAALRVLQHGLNVRQTEELVANFSKPRGAGKPGVTAPIRDAHVANLETRLRERLGTKVQLRYRDGKGTLDIRFFSNDELERLLEILGVAVE